MKRGAVLRRLLGYLAILSLAHCSCDALRASQNSLALPRKETSRKSSGSDVVASSSDGADVSPASLKQMRRKLDREFLGVALPAFVSLAADPLASLVDTIYVGRLGAVEQAGMGIAISAQYSVAKLYNDPLLKTSTSLVAGKSGDELAASVATAMSTAIFIGLLQCCLFLFGSGPIMNFMGAGKASAMRAPALSYLKWRAVGIPAATILLVSNSIFRGRGDTKTPLYCTSMGNLVNILLDPILIFNCKMGCAGAGLATAISQWITIMPMMYFLNKKIPFITLIMKRDENTQSFFQSAIQSYYKAGGLLLLRTVAKISSYTVTAAAAARLGAVPMAAYSLTFNLGFATSQLCESISIAVQALLARDMPLTTERKRIAAGHTMQRALGLGILVSGLLSIATTLNMEKVIGKLTVVPEVRAAAIAIMPVVLATQVFKGLAYSTGGILLGGLDWAFTTLSMCTASVVCTLLVRVLPASLWNVWAALAAFMATQVACSAARFLSGTGPWKGVSVFRPQAHAGEQPQRRA